MNFWAKKCWMQYHDPLDLAILFNGIPKKRFFCTEAGKIDMTRFSGVHVFFSKDVHLFFSKYYSKDVSFHMNSRAIARST